MNQFMFVHEYVFNLMLIIHGNWKAWVNSASCHHPDSKVHEANMGPIWGRQDPDGPHVGPMIFAIWLQGPLLLIGFNFNPSMYKEWYPVGNG